MREWITQLAKAAAAVAAPRRSRLLKPQQTRAVSRAMDEAGSNAQPPHRYGRTVGGTPRERQAQ